MNKYLTLTIAALFLSACQHENPLQTHSKTISAEFLVNASANAEKRLHFPIHKDAYGFAYLECMEGKKTPEIQCNDLYQSMITFANEGHYLGFQKLTLADLTDPQVFTSLADDYAEFAATHWPHFIPVGQS